jgi:hypothetical protein
MVSFARRIMQTQQAGIPVTVNGRVVERCSFTRALELQRGNNVNVIRRRKRGGIVEIQVFIPHCCKGRHTKEAAEVSGFPDWN